MTVVFYSIVSCLVLSMLVTGVLSTAYYYKLDAEKRNPFHNPSNPNIKSQNIFKWISYLLKPEHATEPMPKAIVISFFMFLLSLAALVVCLFNLDRVFYH